CRAGGTKFGKGDRPTGSPMPMRHHSQGPIPQLRGPPGAGPAEATQRPGVVYGPDGAQHGADDGKGDEAPQRLGRQLCCGQAVLEVVEEPPGLVSEVVAG